MAPNEKKSLRFDESRRLLARLSVVESPDVTFVGESFPIVMKKGRGLRITDVDGNRYLDFTACFGVLALGHRHPVVHRALLRQAGRLVHGMGDVHPSAPKVELLELLARLSPFTKPQTVLSLSGGEALESALKTAMLATGRSSFVSFAGGYHGLHFGPLRLTDRPHFTRGFEAWTAEGGNAVLPFPDSLPLFRCERGEDVDPTLQAQHGLLPADEVLTRLEDTLRSRRFAALVVEPLQGRGGDRTFPPGFLARCAELARAHGTLVIFDEVFTGFGRTGTLFGHEEHGVVPDLLCLGKALGGGLPLSACLGDVMEVWGRSQGEARHTSTFLGHPLACAVGVACVRRIQRLLPEFQSESRAIHEELNSFVARSRALGLDEHVPFRIRGRGFMHGIWFPHAPSGFAAGLAEDLLLRGIIALPSGPRGDVLSLTPPLVAKARDYRLVLRTVEELLLSRTRPEGNRGDAVENKL